MSTIRATLSIINEALFILDPYGVILFANQAAAALFGRSEAGLVNRPLTSLLLLCPDNEKGTRSFLRGESAERYLDVAALLPDGTTRHLEISLSGIPADQSSAVAICMVHDITARKLVEHDLHDIRKKLEDQIEERTSKLDQAHEKLLLTEKLCAVGKLSASIAHEFGSPIFAIRNLLSSMKQQSCNAPDSMLIDLGIQECQRLKALLDNLQDFYRPTVQAMKAMDLNRVISDVAALYRKSMEKNNIQLTVATHAELPLFFGSENQIKQVIINLLSNAMDATSAKGGDIFIRTGLTAGKITIEISDSGPGIREELLDHIFEPFVTSKDEKIGTGLGLSISYGIITGHGGEINVTSSDDHGTTFLIELPCNY